MTPSARQRGAGGQGAVMPTAQQANPGARTAPQPKTDGGPVSQGAKRSRRLPEAVQTAIDAAEAADTRERALRVSLVLPFPPSLNHLYPTVVTKTGKLLRTKSKAGKEYDQRVKSTLALWIASHDRRPPAPPYALTLRIFPPIDGRPHDLTNCFKAPEDSLMAAIGGNDVDVLQVAGRKMPPDHWPRIELTLEHMEEVG